MWQRRVRMFAVVGLALWGIACAAPPESAPRPTAVAAKPAAPAAQPTTAAAAPPPTRAPAAPAATTPATASGAPIKLGMLADLTGPFAPQGAELRLNTELGVKQWNDSGGVDGRPIEALYVDPRSDPAQALQLATQLIQSDRVDVLVGGVGSNECGAVQELVAKTQTVYLTSSGCAAEEITAKSCNLYTFRFVPQGRQSMLPLTKYLVEKVGKTWGLMYPDYAFGQSTLAAFGAGLKEAGGSLPTTIPVPLTDTNLTPYVTKIPTDGSIVGLYDSLTGAQAVNSVAAIKQFGIAAKIALVIAGGKDGFGGVYPDVVNGAIFNSFSPDDPQNVFMQQYIANFRQAARANADVAKIIGGPDNAHPGSQMGISGYTPIQALKHAMRQIHYTGPEDKSKLIDTLAHFQAQQSEDFPGGDVVMDPNDHQARMTLYVSQVNGQTEKVLFATPPDQIPPIGTCKVGG